MLLFPDLAHLVNPALRGEIARRCNRFLCGISQPPYWSNTEMGNGKNNKNNEANSTEKTTKYTWIVPMPQRGRVPAFQHFVPLWNWDVIWFYSVLCDIIRDK